VNFVWLGRYFKKNNVTSRYAVRHIEIIIMFVRVAKIRIAETVTIIKINVKNVLQIFT
jgi:hypothetical protein